VSPSPCVKVCVLDPVRGLCTGCARSLDEIARWATMSEAERRAVREALPARRAAMYGEAGASSSRAA